MMMRTAMVLCLLLALACLGACGGSNGVPQPNQSLESPTQLEGDANSNLPNPADVTHEASANSQQRFKRGAEYIPSFKANAGKNGNVKAQFEPNYNGVDQFSLAWLLYSFYLPDYSQGNSVKVYFDDGMTLPEDGIAWLGLADWDLNAWSWYPILTSQAELNGSVIVTGVPTANHISDQGELLACMLCTGTEMVMLTALQVGDQLGPVAVPTASPSVFASDGNTTLNGTHSFSELSTIVSYEWDLESDGVFDETGSFVDSVTYEPGEYDITMRVTDDNDVSVDAKCHILVWDALNPPDYLEIEDNDTMETAQQLPGMPLDDFTGNLGAGGANDGDTSDWYEFEWYRDSKFLVHMWIDGGAADLAMELYDEFGNLVAIVDTENDLEQLDTHISAGRYFLHCFTAEGENGSADYELDFFAFFPNEAPQAYLAVIPDILALGEDVSLYANQSIDFDGTIDEYQWDLYGDGHFERTTVGTDTTFTANRAGTFNAKVRVVDNNGAWDEYIVPFTVTGEQSFDEVEDNDVREEAMVLDWFPVSGTPSFLGEIGLGGEYDGDEIDIFSFDITEAGNVQWILNTLDAEHADLEMRLVYGEDDVLTTLALDDSGNDVLAISEDVVFTMGTYYLVIMLQHGSSRYDFSLHFTP